MAGKYYPNLFEPITLGKTVYRNRIFASPTGFRNGDFRAFPNKDLIAYYELKAKGGFAAVTMGDCIVNCTTGHICDVQFPIDDHSSMPTLAMLAQSISRHGAVPSVELQHGGMYARLAAEQGRPIYGPVETEIVARNSADPQDHGGTEMTHVFEMPEEMILSLIRDYGEAAAFAKQVGFGMVMVHAGHGWLLSQFMSPRLNNRKDKWGGSLENRMRFPLAVIEEIRRRCGRDFPIEVRISGSECNPAGYDLDEGIELAKALDGKVDLLHVSAGHHEIGEVFYTTHPSMFHEDGCNVKYAAEIKKHVKCPVATVGALTSVEQMEEIIASGQADVVNLGRESLADPELPNKAMHGKADEITECLRCYSCFSKCSQTSLFYCAVNPVIGNEFEAKFDIQPKFKKKILIAGGGIAGMQAALTAKEKGHDVVLCEKLPVLGGTLRCEEKVPFKQKLSQYLDHQAHMVEKAGIDLRLNTEVTPELAKEIGADVVIAAVGARPVKPAIPGIDNANVYGAEEIYVKPELAGKSVVILGGGLVGVELGLFMAMQGKKVTVLEMLPELNWGSAPVHGDLLNMKIKEYGLNIATGTRALEITPEGVVGESLADGMKTVFAGDTVIYAVGQKPEWAAADGLRNCAEEFYQIGDCYAPRNIMEATQAAYYRVLDIGRY